MSRLRLAENLLRAQGCTDLADAVHAEYVKTLPRASKRPPKKPKASKPEPPAEPTDTEE